MAISFFKKCADEGYEQIRDAVLFYLNDDRGLDLVAFEKSALYSIYEKRYS